MICPFCNKETADNSVFCAHCGNKLTGIQPAAVPENKILNEETVASSPAQESNPSSQNIPPQNSPYSQVYNNPVQNGTYTPPPPQNNDFWVNGLPKKKSKAKFLIPLIAIILVGAIVAGLIIFSPFSGPLTAILKAAKKTSECGSFNFIAKLQSNGQDLKLNGTIVYDLGNRKIELRMEGTSSYDNSSALILLKDGILLTIVNDEVEDQTDINKNLKTFFDEYDKNIKENEAKQIDWNELFKTLEMENDVDAEKFGNAFKNFIKDLNDPDYINEYLGEYSKESKDGDIVYSFDLDVSDLSEELINVFGDSFKLQENTSPDDLQDELEKGLNTLAGGNGIELKFTTTSGYLSSFIMDSANMYIKLSMSDFGEAEIKENTFDKYKEYFTK